MTENKRRFSRVPFKVMADITVNEKLYYGNELFNLGYSPILVYKGGFEDWKNHQMPVETGSGEIRDD